MCSTTFPLLYSLSISSSASDRNDDAENSWNDWRSWIAVTIGVMLFLSKRRAMDARRPDLDVGAHDGTVIVYDNVTAASEFYLLSDWNSIVRDVVRVTTASLRWMAGTMMHTLLSAVYLAKAVSAVSFVVE